MCDKNCGGSCDGRKDKEKRVVEISAKSMAEMPMDVREELERIVNGLPEGVRVRVCMSGQRPQIIGEAVDIDHDGGLLIRQDSGLVERVVAGDIIHCKR